jgi:tetratricopeptide (TPR) repeat protein
LPVIGIVLVLYLFKRRNGVQLNEKDSISSAKGSIRKHVAYPKVVDIKKEINIIPFQDALNLNENKIKRKLLIHILKGETGPNITALKKALDDEDSETSHYAATAITEIKRHQQNSIQDLSKQLEDDPNNVNLMIEFVGVLKDFLGNGFLDRDTYKYYQLQQRKLLSNILQRGAGSNQHYIEKINCEIELKEYQEALMDCHRFLEAYPLDEMSYIMTMKVHYSTGNYSGLQSTMKAMLSRPVTLSASGIEIIRFWNKEEKVELRF